MPPRRGELDRQNADLGFISRANRATQAFGKKLVTEAKTEERQFSLYNRFADRRFFRYKPGKFILLSNLHRTAKRPYSIEAVKAWDLLTTFKRNRADIHSIGVKMRPETSQMLGGMVLQDKQSPPLASVFVTHVRTSLDCR